MRTIDVTTRLKFSAAALDSIGLYDQADELDGLREAILSNPFLRSAKFGEWESETIDEKDMGDYVVRKEKVFLDKKMGGDIEVESAYDKKGQYLGSPKDAKQLVEKGITQFEIAQPGHSVCSIGFDPKAKKWYGWSHRAIKGFSIGDEGYVATPQFEGSDGKKIKTLEDAKKAAKKFAESVS